MDSITDMMRSRLSRTLLLFVLFLLSPAIASTMAETAEEHIIITSPSSYTLGAGDTLRIAVFGEEDLSMEIRLSGAGTISYPFLGELEALGKSTIELENIITHGLKNGYMINPKVNVSIEAYREFFINGEVKNPGGYPFQPGLTLGKAITLAGGFTERASHSKIFVIREHDDKKQSVRMELGDQVRPGDIVTVEESFF